MSWRSAIYTGQLVHVRTGAVTDRFAYPVYFFGFDLGELPALDRGLRLFAHNRPGLFSLRDRDYRGAAAGLREGAVAFARRGGVSSAIDRVELLTQARVFGYVFNPVSFFFLRDAAGHLVCAVGEVANTYGGRHRYLLADHQRIEGRDRGDAFATDKAFYVSPYIHDAARYHWFFETTPTEHRVAMDVLDSGGQRFFRATMSGRRRELSDRALAGLLARYPLMTVQIISLIHWHAFKLRRRGVEHQAPPARDTAR